MAYPYSSFWYLRLPFHDFYFRKSPIFSKSSGPGICWCFRYLGVSLGTNCGQQGIQISPTSYTRSKLANFFATRKMLLQSNILYRLLRPCVFKTLYPFHKIPNLHRQELSEIGQNWLCWALALHEFGNHDFTKKMQKNSKFSIFGIFESPKNIEKSLFDNTNRFLQLGTTIIHHMSAFNNKFALQENFARHCPKHGNLLLQSNIFYAVYH